MPFWNKKSGATPSALYLAVEARLQTSKVTCPKCKKVYTGQEAFEHLYICPECGKIEFFRPVRPQQTEQDESAAYDGPDPSGFYIPGVAEDVKCYQCGKEHPADDPFCPLCGMPTRRPEPKTCEWCGAALTGGEERCPHCGAGLRRE